MASFGKFTEDTFRTSSQNQVRQCCIGIEEIQKLKEEVENKYKDMLTSRTDLYIGNTVKQGIRDGRKRCISQEDN